MHRRKIFASVILALFIVVVFQGSAPTAISTAVDPRVTTLEQTPPELLGIKVQKLSQPIGANTMIMRISLDTSICYETITDSINIYYDSIQYLTFKDDGVFPDITSGDGQFASLVVENITTFRADVVNRINSMSAAGKYLKFIGHSGQWITTIPTFDFGNFDAFGEVDLHVDIVSHLTTSTSCGILKQNSLFITDLSVVEDPARTYNVVTKSGNSAGVWTFGNMIKGMCGNLTPSLPLPTYYIAPKDLLKSWIRNWTYLTHQINDQDIYERTNVYQLLIRPWLIEAGVSITVPLDHNNWEYYWDMANENSLLIEAPFKLTAIVNRIDTRGNTAYSGSINNAGETRFIYTLVDYETGGPVKHPDQGGGFPPLMDGENFIDWEGLNVILEYGNVQTSTCALKNFAQDWVNLSSIPLPSPAFNDALELITHTVIDANAGGSSKPNGTALNRIRTNERIFDFASAVGDSKFPKGGKWEHSEWEFRQFEINPVSHEFEQTILPNVPIESSNFTMNLHRFTIIPPPTNGLLTNIPAPVIPYYYNPYNNIQQVVTNPFIKKSILRGNFNLPRYNPFTMDPILSPIGWVRGEFSHYFDVISDTYYPAIMTPIEKEEHENMRHQISLNTCQGCHAGENKTLFTHVAPMGYGKSANYWDATPEHQERFLDVRHVSSATAPAPMPPISSLFSDSQVPINEGTTQIGSITYNNYIVDGHKSYYQNLSPFLTGRRYSGLVGSGNFNDDLIDPMDDIDDNNLDGLFYVYDPSNLSSTPLLPANNTFGYNDLKKREDDLCLFVNSECAFSILNLGSKLKFVPLPFGGH